MRFRSLPIRSSAALLVVWIAASPAGAGGPAHADDAPGGWEEPCIVSPDSGPVSVTGVLGHGYADGWGEYQVAPDPGIRAWEIRVACSIETDWESLLDRRVHVEGTAVLVWGGYAGSLGEALGVARLEVLTPTRSTTWGRVRSLYR